MWSIWKCSHITSSVKLCFSYRLERVDEKTRLKIHQKVAARATPSGSALHGTSSKELRTDVEENENDCFLCLHSGECVFFPLLFPKWEIQFETHAGNLN